MSQLTETSRNVPNRTRTDRNGPKRTYKTTKTDFNGYRNGLYSFSKTEKNVVSAHKETNIMGTRKGRPGNGRKQVYVCGGGMEVERLVGSMVGR